MAVPYPGSLLRNPRGISKGGDARLSKKRRHKHLRFPSSDGMRIYQNLRDEGRLPLRLRCQIILTGKDPGFQQFVLNYGPRAGFGEDWLRLGGIKLFVDGETESAVRYDPPGQRVKWIGGARYTQEELNDVVLRAHKAGFQVWTHALGDKAQDMILEA